MNKINLQKGFIAPIIIVLAIFMTAILIEIMAEKNLNKKEPVTQTQDENVGSGGQVVNSTNSFSNGVVIGSGSGVWTLGADANNSNAFVISPNSNLNPGYLTITQTGTVGISSSTPWAQFSVNGLAGGSIPLFVVASSTATNATGTAFMVDSNGNVGIASSTPWGVLSIDNTNPSLPYLVISSSTAGLLTVRANGNAGEIGINTLSNALSSGVGGLNVNGQGRFTSNVFIPSASTGIFFSTVGSFAPGIIRNSVSNIVFVGNGRTTSDSGALVYSGNNFVGVGSSTPFAKLGIHLSPSDQVSSLIPFAIGSSTASATSSLLMVRNNGSVSISTTSPNFSYLLNLGTNPGSTASTTIRMKKLQFEGENSAGTVSCLYVVGTTVTVTASACNN